MSNESGIVIYKLKNGKTPNTYGIKQYNVMIDTEKGYKEIGYYPGGTSIFADDNKKRQKEGIVFEFNGVDATEFVASKNNIILNKYLQSHPDFNKDFEIFSKELQSQQELARFEKIEKALEKINETDTVKIKAMALAIYGMDAYNISETAANAMLKKTAINEPDVILLKMEHSNYKFHFLSAHAFFANVVKENEHKTAVIWNDPTMGTILHLATGETGIYKLAEVLAVDDAEARKITQTIGERLMMANGDLDRKQVVYVDNSAEKDNEIAKLKAELEAMKNAKSDSAPVIETKKEEVIEEDLKKSTEEEKNEEKLDGSDGKTEAEKLVDLREAYKTKFDKEVPPVMKNNATWISGKLTE